MKTLSSKTWIMGNTDTITKNYMRNPEVFADAFNCFMYNGRQVIKADELNELDTTEISVLLGKDGKRFDKQVYRDILKYATLKEDGSNAYLILGIENQTGVNYTMPIKVMLYDVLQYISQTDNTRRDLKHIKNEKGLSGDEYISGFRKSDKLLPVITLVVYFGSKPWDGPKSLHQMIDADEGILKHIDDYKLKLLEPAMMNDDEIAKFSSDLKDVFYFIKYSEDKAKLQEIMDDNPEFQKIRRSTAEVINELTNSRISIEDEGEEIDMCKAIRDMREESEAIGVKKGMELGKTEGEMNKAKAIAKAMKERGMDDALVFELTGISL